MTDRRAQPVRYGTLLALSLCFAMTAQAQLSTRSARQLGAASEIGSNMTTTRTADYVVALVNSEPVTNNEVRSRLLRIEKGLTQQNTPLPPRSELTLQILEAIINERLQLQRAAEMGLRIDNFSLLQAEQALAAQNQLNTEEFYRRAAAEGVDSTTLREQLRRQLLLQQVRERDVDARVTVSESEIDDFMREQRNNSDPSELGLNLSHILIRLPEGASAELIKKLEARAQQIADRARQGEDFAKLANQYSDAPEAIRGGAFGMRSADRLPSIFVDATQKLNAGEIAGPLRSPAGFHVLQLVEKRQSGLPDVAIAQTRVRHILLRTGPNLSSNDALAQLGQLREQINVGKISFEAAAQEHSQDGSANAGGDLGWAVSGQFVPEFEQIMNSLRPGELSQPIVSRFGAHLIQVQERREVRMTEREQRETVRSLVSERKAADALQNWIQDLRSRAYVEYREAPQP